MNMKQIEKRWIWGATSMLKNMTHHAWQWKKWTTMNMKTKTSMTMNNMKPCTCMTMENMKHHAWQWKSEPPWKWTQTPPWLWPWKAWNHVHGQHETTPMKTMNHHAWQWNTWTTMNMKTQTTMTMTAENLNHHDHDHDHEKHEPPWTWKNNELHDLKHDHVETHEQ